MENDNNWTLECQIAFDKLKAQVANIVELRHFDIHRDMRIVCDTSHKRIGDVREKLGSASRRGLSFVSCYPDGGKKNYPTDELEMLAVVWGQNLMKKLRNIKENFGCDRSSSFSLTVERYQQKEQNYAQPTYTVVRPSYIFWFSLNTLTRGKNQPRRLLVKKPKLGSESS